MILKDNFLKEVLQPSTSVGVTVATGTTVGAMALTDIINLLNPTSSFLSLGKLKDFTGLQQKNFFSNISVVMFNLFRYYFFNPSGIKPAVVLAGMPLPSIQEISHAISDRDLQYRATGGIFLAHQEGGEQSLRIKGKAFGLNRYVFLAMLDLLFLYGSSRIVDHFKDVITGTASLVSDTCGWAEPVPSTDPWSKLDIYNLDEGKEEAHLTFPIITRTKIYTNMYIETYEFTESIENGMNCVTYSIFFRKYLPQYPYKFQKTKDGVGSYANDVLYFTKDNDNDIVKTIRKVDTLMDIGYSTSMLMYRFLQFYEGNSPEHNIAHITAINLSKEYYGEDDFGKLLQAVDPDLDYNLAGLSTNQKAELMALD